VVQIRQPNTRVYYDLQEIGSRISKKYWKSSSSSIGSNRSKKELVFLARTEEFIREVDRYSARNYNPLPVVIERGEGVWVWDVEGNKYLEYALRLLRLEPGAQAPKDHLRPDGAGGQVHPHLPGLSQMRPWGRF